MQQVEEDIGGGDGDRRPPLSPPSSPLSSDLSEKDDDDGIHFPMPPPIGAPTSPHSLSLEATPSMSTTLPSLSLAHMMTTNQANGRNVPGLSLSSSGPFLNETRSKLPRGDLGRMALQQSSNTNHTKDEAEEGGRAFQNDHPYDDGVHAEANDQTRMAQTVVWGTNVNVASTCAALRVFVHEYQLHSEREETDPPLLPYYLRVLDQMHITEQYVVSIDCAQLLEFRETREVYDQLIKYPQVLIRLLDMVITEEYEARHGTLPPEAVIQVRVFGVRNQIPMRDLNPVDIDQLVSIKGMITRCSPVIPDLKTAFFQCSQCRATDTAELDRGRIEEPTTCPHCQASFSMQMIHNRCAFTDKQMVKMQETPDAIPEGETPQTVTLFAFDDLVDATRPGDKVIVTGIYRAVPIRKTSKQRVLRSVFKTYIDVIHFQIVDGSREQESTENESNNVNANDGNQLQDVQEEKRQIYEKLSQDPDIYMKLAQSLAPSIWEMEDVKKGVLCQLFGGVKHKTNENNANKAFRGDINVLLCGDPGTSKSQLLSYVHRLAPRGIYTSGKGSSAVGLTASVLRDPETGDLVLESGALVLSDQGICCIDEFDKMNDSARAVLHEVMEQQTVSIAKAGIICSLNARTAILASANPIESRYNAQKSVIANINILPTLLSRFDLIYLVIDRANAESDRRLAKHIVSLYYAKPTAAPPPVSMSLLKDYIAYAKANIQPQLTESAKTALIKGYLNLRSMGSNRKCITATPRQLESLIRIAEAHARIRFSSTVDTQDVTEAFRLMNVATQRTAMDPRTGTIDMELLTTGRTAGDRQAILSLADDIRAILQNSTNKIWTRAELRLLLIKEKPTTTAPPHLHTSTEKENQTNLQKHTHTAATVISADDVENALRMLQEENVISITSPTQFHLL